MVITSYKDSIVAILHLQNLYKQQNTIFLYLSKNKKHPDIFLTMSVSTPNIIIILYETI